MFAATSAYVHLKLPETLTPANRSLAESGEVKEEDLASYIRCIDVLFSYGVLQVQREVGPLNT